MKFILTTTGFNVASLQVKSHLIQVTFNIFLHFDNHFGNAKRKYRPRELYNQRKPNE